MGAKSRANFLAAALALAAMALPGCGSSSTSSTNSSVPSVEGSRFKATLVRAVDEAEWVKVTGTQEWWFFRAGVFRQISSAYVEPQFYGDSGACNGSGSGSYVVADPPEGQDGMGGRHRLLTMTYDGRRDVSGLCRMTDRQVHVYLQPGALMDVVDGVRVVRLERTEELQ